MNKRLAIALYLCFGILLTLVLTFGKSVSHSLIDLINIETKKVRIDDVSVELEESYIVGKTISPTYTALGRIGGDPCLRFEALDGTVTVDKKTGEFKGVRTDSDTTVGRIRISSEADLDFEKIITVSFIKKYPDNVKARFIVKSLGTNASYTRVGVPVSAYVKVDDGEVYSESSFTVQYDPEYFEYIDSRTLMPIKATPAGVEVSLTYVYANGKSVTTPSFVIKKEKEVESFDEIRLTNKSSKPDGTVGSFYFITLYKGGKKVVTDYTLDFESGRAGVSSIGRLTYKKTGTDRVTVTLPNGYSQVLDVNIQNVVIAPKLLTDDENTLKLFLKNETNIPLVFDSSATYEKVKLEYDDEMLTASVKDGILTVKGKKLGESALKLTVDDGTLHDDITYTVKTVIDTDIGRIIKNSTSIFVHKILGHICCFSTLAFFALNMFRFFKKRRGVLRFLHYSACALVFAALTEFIQLFLPTRTGSISDIMIDMTGYYIGSILLYPIFTLVTRRGRLLNEKMAKSGHVKELKSVIVD